MSDSTSAIKLKKLVQQVGEVAELTRRRNRRKWIKRANFGVQERGGSGGEGERGEKGKEGELSLEVDPFKVSFSTGLDNN